MKRIVFAILVMAPGLFAARISATMLMHQYCLNNNRSEAFCTCVDIQLEQQVGWSEASQLQARFFTNSLGPVDNRVIQESIGACNQQEAASVQQQRQRDQDWEEHLQRQRRNHAILDGMGPH